MQGHNVKYYIIYSVPPGWVRTDKKDMVVICYICSEFTEGWESVKEGQKERGEEKVRNVFMCKDHKFNTFPCTSREADGPSYRKGNGESDEETGKGICDKSENGGCARREPEEINKAR